MFISLHCLVTTYVSTIAGSQKLSHLMIFCKLVHPKEDGDPEKLALVLGPLDLGIKELE